MTWHLDDASVASLAPDGRSVWVTGVSPGLAYLGARLVFGDGAEVEAQERAIRVVPPEAPPQGSLLIIEGDLTIPSFGSGQDWNGWVPFTTTTTGRIDVSVNWISPQCEIWVRGNEGHCNAPGGCGTLVMIARDTGVRPLTATFDDPRMPPGDYTLHFENRSLHEETVHYEVRLTPN